MAKEAIFAVIAQGSSGFALPGDTPVWFGSLNASRSAEVFMDCSVAIDDLWIVNQLAGIKALELEINSALVTEGTGGSSSVRVRMIELNAWADSFEQALAQQRTSERKRFTRISRPALASPRRIALTSRAQ